MHFTPKEQDKLTLLCVGLIAERRLKKGLKLNYPESVAYITSCALEGGPAPRVRSSPVCGAPREGRSHR